MKSGKRRDWIKESSSIRTEKDRETHTDSTRGHRTDEHVNIHRVYIQAVQFGCPTCLAELRGTPALA